MPIEDESRTVSVVPVDDLTGGMWWPLIFHVTHAATRLTHCVISQYIQEGFIVTYLLHIISRALIITRVQRYTFARFKTNRCTSERRDSWTI